MTMGSRVLTTLGVVLCALGVTVAAAAAAAAAPVTAGTTAQAHPHPHPQQSQPPIEGEVDIDPSDLPGDGSESTPYEISNVSELQAMEDDLDANYELVSDIDASQTAQFNDGAGFDPIGSGNTSFFSGSFDGTNHTITGLTIDRPTESTVGVIGVLANEGTIQNVTLTEMNVTGANVVGGLVGTNIGNITDATASGSVTGTNGVGGLVGNNLRGGTVEQSYFDTEATGQTTSAGSATGLTTAEMQGTAAAQNMALAFGETWQTVSGDYPELIALADSESDSDSGSTTIVDEFDTDGDGEISITELGQAGQAFASGEISITELGEVGAAFAS